MNIKSHESIVRNYKFEEMIRQLVRNSIMPKLLRLWYSKIKRHKNSSNQLIFMEHSQKQE